MQKMNHQHSINIPKVEAKYFLFKIQQGNFVERGANILFSEISPKNFYVIIF